MAPLSPSASFDILHGTAVRDPYRFLEDTNDPRTVAWVADQDLRLQRLVREKLGTDCWERRLRDLVDPGFGTQPVWRGDRYFRTRSADGRSQPTIWVGGTDRDERPLTDLGKFGISDTATLDMWQLSPDGRCVALQYSDSGSENSALYIIDIDRDVLLDGPIQGTRYSPIGWLPSINAYYYVRALTVEEAPRAGSGASRRLFLRRPGSAMTADVEVAGRELSPASRFMFNTSRDERWLMVSVTEGTSRANKVLLADLKKSQPWSPLFRELANHEGSSSSVFLGFPEWAYALTNHGADRGRLCRFDPTGPLDTEAWTTVIAEDESAVLRDVAILEYEELDTPLAIATWIKGGYNELSVHELTTGRRRGEVALPGAGTVSGLGIRPEGGSEAWFTFSSPSHPAQILHYDARSRTTTVWEDKTRSRSETTTSIVDIDSRHGDDIRLFITEPSNRPPGPAPALVKIYGGFGVTTTAHYSQEAAVWTEKGGIYVEVDSRGGGGRGSRWAAAGRAAGKQHVIDDFVTACEWLIARHKTTPSRLAVVGSSNGGLVVCAALVQRPELFAAATAIAPLTDMIRYERSGLGPAWREEYGSAEDPAQFQTLLGYSPYHHVESGIDYPAVLLVSFENDTRVPPLHARKFGAALQEAAPDASKIFVATLRGGHGSRSIDAAIEMVALTVSFASHFTSDRTADRKN